MNDFMSSLCSSCHHILSLNTDIHSKQDLVNVVFDILCKQTYLKFLISIAESEAAPPAPTPIKKTAFKALT